jgi:hypothetical protein
MVQVSLEGGDWKRAEQEIKLFPGDSVQTASNANASLTFFDGTFLRLDEQSTLRIEESEHGQDDSTITLELESGSAWVATPAMSAFTGAIVRQVVTPLFTVEIPTRTETVLSGQSIVVYDADGPGATITVAGSRKQVIVGEGQALALPDNPATATDLYAFRSALDPRAVTTPFVEESRQQYGSHWKPGDPITPPSGSGTVASTPLPTGSLLVIDAPENGAVVGGSTVEVLGSVDKASVSNVRVNGYAAQMNATTGTFRIELALSDDEEITINVEGINRDGIVVDEASVQLVRNMEPPAAPAFTFPAANGETFQTQQRRIQIRGTAPPRTAGIIVNDYRLQLFKPGDTTWSYIANAEMDNFQEGENIFTAVAIDADGRRSAPVAMTIILGGETEGVVEGAAPTEGEESEAEEITGPTDQSTLPQNDPLQPGSIAVSAPSAGTQHVASGTSTTEFLIEGTVPSGTATVWVNNYRLRLFESGKTFWNYIAGVELGTMKAGRNEYEVIARNEQNEIIDRFTYVIEFTQQ